MTKQHSQNTKLTSCSTEYLICLPVSQLCTHKLCEGREVLVWPVLVNLLDGGVMAFGRINDPILYKLSELGVV